MTEQQQSPSPDPAEPYTSEYRRLWDATVTTLTAAVQLNHPQHGAVDFSDFLASALAAVAANVGSAERITAGRSGSWESDAVERLVYGTVSYDAHPVELAVRRTIPVLVPLNVAQLLSEAYQDAPPEQRATMLPHVDDAAQAIYTAGEAWCEQHPAPNQDATAGERDAYAAAADAQSEQEQTAHDELRRRYLEAFETYAQAFAAAVYEEARGIAGLAVPVEVQVEADPEATWWVDDDTINPGIFNTDDALVLHLWSAARGRVPLPVLAPTSTTE